MKKGYGSIESAIAPTLWEKTIEDVTSGYVLGPFLSQSAVSNLLGREDWVCMPRFLVRQLGKIRPVDDGSRTGSGANFYGFMQEQLQVLSVDFAVTVTRYMKRLIGGAELGAWTVDEKSAFRQIPVHHEHRHLSVIALCDPSCGSVRFFVMIGHPFGMTASVMNYCRRSYALNQFLIRSLRMASMSFCDDKFAFSQAEVVQQQKDLVLSVSKWLGIRMSEKTEWGQHVTILGIIFDFHSGVLAIKPTRREDLKLEITRALEEDWFPPGAAAKMRGKLLFISSHFSGRHGRTYPKAIADRQWNTAGGYTLGTELRRSLRTWLNTLDSNSGARSLFGEMEERTADVVVFSDGSHPDPRDDQSCQDLPRAGWVACIKGKSNGRPGFVQQLGRHTFYGCKMV